MEKKNTLIDAVSRVLKEDKRTQRYEYNWLFLAKTLREMGFKIFINFDPRMPSPETLFRERREVLNRKNKYSKDFILEDNVTIEKDGDKKIL